MLGKLCRNSRCSSRRVCRGSARVGRCAGSPSTPPSSPPLLGERGTTVRSRVHHGGLLCRRELRWCDARRSPGCFPCGLSHCTAATSRYHRRATETADCPPPTPSLPLLFAVHWQRRSRLHLSVSSVVRLHVRLRPVTRCAPSSWRPHAAEGKRKQLRGGQIRHRGRHVTAPLRFVVLPRCCLVVDLPVMTMTQLLLLL